MVDRVILRGHAFIENVKRCILWPKPHTEYAGR
jgi:hypothetical protein